MEEDHICSENPYVQYPRKYMPITPKIVKFYEEYFPIYRDKIINIIKELDKKALKGIPNPQPEIYYKPANFDNIFFE